VPKPDHTQQGLTVVNRFTVQHDDDRLEQELIRTSDFLRRQPDFEFIVRVRLVRQQNVFVQLGYWRTHAAFVNAIRQRPFVAQVERLSPLVLETQADQAVSVARVIAPRTCSVPGEAFGVLTEYILDGDRAGFEATAHEQALSYLDFPGFGGSDLLRSTLRPHRYLGISWWYDGDDFASATRDGYPVRPGHALAVRVEQTRRIAYEAAIPPR